MILQVPASLSPDPHRWDRNDVATFLQFCEREYDLPSIELSFFAMDGKTLCMLAKCDFIDRCRGAGDLLHNVLHYLINRLIKRRAPASPKFKPTHGRNNYHPYRQPPCKFHFFLKVTILKVTYRNLFKKKLVCSVHSASSWIHLPPNRPNGPPILSRKLPSAFSPVVPRKLPPTWSPALPPVLPPALPPVLPSVFPQILPPALPPVLLPPWQGVSPTPSIHSDQKNASTSSHISSEGDEWSAPRTPMPLTEHISNVMSTWPSGVYADTQFYGVASYTAPTFFASPVSFGAPVTMHPLILCAPISYHMFHAPSYQQMVYLETPSHRHGSILKKKKKKISKEVGISFPIQWISVKRIEFNFRLLIISIIVYCLFLFFSPTGIMRIFIRIIERRSLQRYHCLEGSRIESFRVY